MEYRGYIITKVSGGGFDISHSKFEVRDFFDTTLAPNTTSAKQWIDEDIRCRKEGI